MRKHIKTVNKAILKKTLKTGGCRQNALLPANLPAKLPALLAIRFANKNNSGRGLI